MVGGIERGRKAGRRAVATDPRRVRDGLSTVAEARAAKVLAEDAKEGREEMGLVLMGTLNAPYPDDPAEMDLVEWFQARNAMRNAAAEIERLKSAAADVWDAVAVLAEAGTPPEGFASIARQNAAYLRSADKGE